MTRFFVILIFLLKVLSSLAQTAYWKMVNSNKQRHFYWDLHYEVESKKPKNVSKEFIYHIANENDSLLEKEITYNRLGRAVEIKTYAVPTRGGVVFLDSLYYNSSGLLSKRITFSEGWNYGTIDTSSLQYFYDEYRREETRIQKGRGRDYTYKTVYSSDSMQKKESRDSESVNPLTKVYFYQRDREDSVQVFVDSWAHTIVHEYDSVKKTKTTFIRLSATKKELQSKIIYLNDSTVESVTYYSLPNWNDTKSFKVESLFKYYEDGSTKQCDFYINNRQRFFKRHHYQTFK